MFDALRGSFSKTIKKISQKELNEKDINEILTELEFSLLESDVALPVIDSIKENLKKHLTGTMVDKKEIAQFIKTSLIQDISSYFDASGTIDIFEQIESKKAVGKPYIILFVGINGTGKTTTLAKFAHMLSKKQYSVVLSAADTFRAGAIEQLREHSNRLGLKLIAQNYGSDPAAVAKDAILYAQSHKTDCVLIDTAGRMQTSTNLMDQIAKITKVVSPDLKIFVGDSLAGNDTVSQAKTFHESTQFDCSVLTKCDADSRGGAALSIVHTTSTPIIYLGVGQEYDDLAPFDKQVFIDTVFADDPKITLGDSMEQSKQIEQHVKPTDVSEKLQSVSVSESADKIPDSEITPTSNEYLSKDTTTTKTPNPDDPFAGLDTSDINHYVDLHSISPPENDAQARELATNIRKWLDEKEKSRDDSKKEKRSLFNRFKR